MFARFCALRMGAVMSCVLLLPAALLPGETDLLNQEQGQQRIEDSTATSAALLAELVDEFGRNDLKGSDVEILSGIQKVIGNVSGDLMPEIVGQLNAARTGLNAPGRREEALNAYAGQKSASYQMRQVLLEYERQLCHAAISGASTQRDTLLLEIQSLLRNIVQRNARPLPHSAQRGGGFCRTRVSWFCAQICQ